MICQGHKPLPSSGLAFVGAGSNVGDREELLKSAVRRITEIPGVLTLLSSPVYETLPVGTAGPNNFLNAVFQLTVRLSPLTLFEHLQRIETELGRRPPRSGPRPIDLDLLFFDDLVLGTEALTVPHPRVHLRAFVLKPLADLAPSFCHPELGASISDLLTALSEPSEILGQVSEELIIEHSAFSL
jgi:2-amino-4-hydroxy-6-hydroxymethyldihydropteridine diphosphokinase